MKYLGPTLWKRWSGYPLINCIEYNQLGGKVRGKTRVVNCENAYVRNINRKGC